jgi:hypothetical protein
VFRPWRGLGWRWLRAKMPGFIHEAKPHWGHFVALRGTSHADTECGRRDALSSLMGERAAVHERNGTALSGYNEIRKAGGTGGFDPKVLDSRFKLWNPLRFWSFCYRPLRSRNGGIINSRRPGLAYRTKHKKRAGFSPCPLRQNPH